MIIKKDTEKLLSFLSEGFILFDKNGKIVFINPYAVFLLGCTEKEIKKKHINEAFSIYIEEDLLKPKDKTFPSILSGKKGDFLSTTKKTIYFESKDGEKFPVSSSVRKMVLDGNNVGILIFRDITTEEELRRSKAHIETVIEGLASGLIEYTSDFKIVRINHAAEDMLGVKREDVVGYKIKPKDVKKENLKSLAEASYPALSEGARVVHDATSNTAELGGINEISINYPIERELQIIATPVISSASGDRKGFVKVLRDITREKIISKSKSEFISIAAHQLRTPLSAIKWAIRLIADGDLGPLTPAQLELLNRGYDTNEKMIILVNDLLNVARIEDGRFGYEFKENDLIKTISYLVSQLAILAKEKNITIDFKKPKEESTPFVFDADKISLALQNLIDNAIKYSPKGGTVTISVHKKRDHIITCVKDSGVGIPKDQINRLFSKFFRASNVIRVNTGTGLGLFIVKNIITRHGGEMNVKSRESRGSEFCFTLPLDSELIPKEEIITGINVAVS